MRQDRYFHSRTQNEDTMCWGLFDSENCMFTRTSTNGMCVARAVNGLFYAARIRVRSGYSFISIFLLAISQFFGGVSHAQDIDRIDIYAIHVPTSFAVDNVDANYIRVNYVYKIEIKDPKYIDAAYTFFFDNDFRHEESYHQETSTTIRIVIDFVHREKVKSFVLMNSGNEFYPIKSPFQSRLMKFQLKENELCTVRHILPFYDWLEYSPLNCK